MPNETSDETASAMCYPPVHVYDEWKDHADELDMSASEFMQAMVESGRKKFDAEVEPDQTNAELREQRNDLKRELEQARSRISQLEGQLYRGARQKIIEYVEDNPGATYKEITIHLGEEVPDMATRTLEDLEGEQVEKQDGEYYPVSDE